MKKGSWVVVLVCLITIVGLLLTATPVFAAEPPEGPGLPEQFTDATNNKIFDNLEKRMAPAGMQQPFGVIVQFNKALSEIDFPALKHQIGPFSAKYEYPSVNAISTTFTKGQIIAAAKHDLVKQIEFNGEVHIFLDMAALWFGAKDARTDFGVDGDADGNSTSYSKGDLVIAVIDTGIDATHVDLDEGKVIGWVDFVRDKTEPYDDHGHGTHVASIAAGTGEASSGTYTGVAPGVALVGVKVLNRRASGTWEDCNAGIQWVIDNKETYGIEVMNISWGASGSSDGTSVTEQLVNKAVAAGIVAVVAAGNAGPKTYTIGVPAAAEEAITVGAMADAGEVGFFQAYWSSRGPTADERIKPDISSPGWKIMAAKYNSTDGYTEMSGTSMSTPFAAGVAALMLDAEPSLLPSDVKTTIMDTAVDWGPPGPDIDYGAGRLDAYEAIRVAAGETTTGPAVPNHEYVADSLGGTNTEDWWDINIASTDYPIAITMIMPDWASSSDPDFDIKLYDPTGAQVASSAGIKRQETIAYQPSVTGVYQLKVYIYTGSGPYFFDLSAGTEAPAPNEPPVAEAGGPYSGDEGSAIAFDASASSDVDGTITLYEWDWDNDGVYDESTTSPTITHTWSDDYSGTVGLRVADDDGATDTDTASVTVNNVAPTAEAGGPYSGDEGSAITLSGSATDPGADTLTYEWDLDNDGDYDDAIGQEVSWTWPDDGTYTVGLKVSDDDGGVGTDTATVNVNDLDPTAAFSYSPASPVVGETVQFTDESTSYDGIASWQWDFGDGTTSSLQNPTHVYQTARTYTVTLTVTEGDLDSATTTQDIVVSEAPNEPPVADAGGPYTGDEGSAIAFDASASSDVDGTITLYEWDWNYDGVYDESTTSPTITHTWSDDYSGTVGLRVADDDGATDTDTASVTVNNVAPTAEAGGPYSGDEGSAITLSGSATDPGADTLTYEWDLDNDGYYDDAIGQEVSWTWPEDGTYTVGLKVSDDDGGVGTDTATVTVNDLDPTAAFSYLPASPVVGETVYFTDDSTSYDGIASWQWDFGDGATSNMQNPSHVYEAAGTYTVTLTVTEGDLDSATTTQDIVVSEAPNEPPVAEAGGPYSGDEGSAITFDASASSDVDGTITLYEWDWDYDGLYDESTTSATITHTWSDDYSGTVGLRVTDDDGATDTDSASVTVNNVAPTAEAGGPYSGDEGSAITLSGSATDPGADTLTYEWDLDNDGVYETPGQSVSNTWPDDGTYTVGLRVTDDDGGVSIDTATVSVNNVAPTAEAGGPYSGDEGSAITLSGSATDPGADTLTYEWDLDNDGYYDDAIGQEVSWTWPEDGTYTVGLKVTDDDGGVGTDTATVNVNDLDPTAAFSYLPASPVVGETVYFTDDSTSYDGIAAWGWDFGDGTTSSLQNPTHTYATAGTYTVTLTVTEADNDSDMASQSITVSEAPTLTSMHVHNIEMSLNQRGPWHEATATVTIMDSDHQPVYRATVTGEWYWSYGTTEEFLGIVSFTTDDSGVGSTKSGKVFRTEHGTFTFIVTDVMADGYIYDPDSNDETTDSIVY